MRSLPNLITLLRILLVAPFVWVLLHGQYGAALLYFAIAGASDGLDGFLAKRYGWASNLGAILDPAADKLLLVAAYFMLGWLGHLPLWLVVLVLLRDLIIVGGALAYYLLIGRYVVEPMWPSKANTVLQILLVVLVLWLLWQGMVLEMAVTVLVYAVLLTTVVSGAAYVWVWSRRALREGGKG